MFARINHIAIISPQYAMLGKFYESLFGMKPGSSPPDSAVSHTDGNVGLQILPRRDGYIAGLDHFGAPTSPTANGSTHSPGSWGAIIAAVRTAASAGPPQPPGCKQRVWELQLVERGRPSDGDSPL